MTGFYVRAEVGGEWGNHEVDQLPDQALENWACNLSRRDALNWCLALARWIRENVRAEPSGSAGPARLDTDPAGTGGDR